MDIGKIIQMVINTVLRRVINGALDKGMGMFARRGRGPQTEADTGDEQPPQDDAMAAKRARQLANQAKRLR